MKGTAFLSRGRLPCFEIRARRSALLVAALLFGHTAAGQSPQLDATPETPGTSGQDARERKRSERTPKHGRPRPPAPPKKPHSVPERADRATKPDKRGPRPPSQRRIPRKQQKVAPAPPRTQPGDDEIIRNLEFFMMLEMLKDYDMFDDVE